MAHKNLIDGTAYEIDGGKAMVGGTVYEIDHGTTLVDGTAYEVGFAEMVTVKITIGNYYYNDSYVTIDGQTYTGENEGTTISVPIGTVIYCNCHVSARNDEKGDITLNGVSVESTVTGAMNLYYEYEHTVNGNMTISFDYIKGDESYIRITEIPQGHALVAITGYAGNANLVHVKINDVVYSNATTLVVPIGTVITCKAHLNDSDAYGLITLNGQTVKRDTSGGGVTYDYTLNGNVGIAISFAKAGGSVAITEQ